MLAHLGLPRTVPGMADAQLLYTSTALAAAIESLLSDPSMPPELDEAEFQVVPR